LDAIIIGPCTPGRHLVGARGSRRCIRFIGSYPIPARWDITSRRPIAVVRPRLHQLAPLPEHRPALIGGLGPVADNMRERGLDGVAVELRFLRRPGFETGAESVWCVLAVPHAPQQSPHGDAR